MGKISTIDELGNDLERLRQTGKRIVLCHGVFDLLHIGHIRYLRKAREFGDILVVTCTPDRFVDKGPGRPAFCEKLRVEALAALDCVDFAAINEWPTAAETLRALKPEVYVKGAEFKNLEDQTGKIAAEATVAQEIGTKLEFVSDIVFSSSHLINKFFSTAPKETENYLEYFRQNHSGKEIIDLLERFKNLTVLLVSDTILDEYIYCSPLGASSKDPVLALLYQSRELFAGGGAAIANHLAQLVKKVIWCTVLGDSPDDEKFVREHLGSNVELRPVYRPGAPTVRKTRMLDSYSLQKSLEIYHMTPDPLPADIGSQLLAEVERAIPEADLALAADFGNGCIDSNVAHYLSSQDIFLAINVQSNAGNRGQHTVGRYRRADFVSLARHEINLEFRNINLANIEMMMELQKKLSARYILLTEGRNGCSILTGRDLHRAPAFAANVVDRVGSGDALFSITALAAFMGFPIDIITFLGNISGSLAVERIGNAQAVAKDQIEKYITALLK